MHVLFEEGGKFLGARVLSQTDATAQVELDSGKRAKLKSAQILAWFEQPPAQLLAAARAVCQEIELELAWEFAPQEEFGFADLAREYFSAQATLEQQVGMLICLFEAPHYFRRAGKGRFRKASADVLAQALAAIEKRQQLQRQIDQWALELGAGRCPQPVREQLYRILFRPDKNGPEYKAVVEAARASRLAPLELLRRAGAIGSAYEFHWRRFLFESFPKGVEFPALQVPVPAEPLPVADVQAFSIDDSSTTEIDDALSVRGLGSPTVVVGIHIAAPALALQPGDPIDQLARARLSTVYVPGTKITMLPDAVVQAHTLEQGRDCPAVSLYVTFDAATLEVMHSETRIERVPIAANLRHDQLDQVVTLEWLRQPEFFHAPGVDPLSPALREQLAFLFRLAEWLKKQREQVRGRPEVVTRPDYSFKLVGAVQPRPDGSEQVQIAMRQRGAPLDLIVSEAMILANSLWGQWLAELGVPGLYRSQASLAPGVKVRMGTRALPHAGIGVKCYAWSTSPLRRYTDLVNQWQLIACARHGRTAALVAPFKPKDAELFSVLSAFEAAYGAYGAFQASMERYWTLRYLEQNGITELDAAVLREGLVRADTLPLVLPVFGADGLARGARVRVRLGTVDAIALDVSATVVARLDPADGGTAGASADALQGDEGEEGDDETVAGPLALALEIDEPAEAAVAAGGDNPPS